jgi:hypothetical protein
MMGIELGMAIPPFSQETVLTLLRRRKTVKMNRGRAPFVMPLAPSLDSRILPLAYD